MLLWCDAVTSPENADTNRTWQMFLTQRELAHKILNDQEHLIQELMACLATKVHRLLRLRCEFLAALSG